MALPNDKRSLQDRLSRVATRMAQKFGNGVFTGVTVGAGASAGIPASVLINRIAGKKVALDSLGRENASALSFTVIDTANGATAATQDQLVANTYVPSQMPVGIYGSPAALVMLAKLKAGTDSVDFIVTGDSNTNSPGAAGWALGLARGLIRGCCSGMYATPLYPSGVCLPNAGTPQPTMSWWRNGNLAPRVNIDGGGGAGNTYGDLRDAPADVASFMDFTGMDVGFAYDRGSGTSIYLSACAYLPRPGGTYFFNEYPTVEYFDPNDLDVRGTGLDTRNALTHRVVHSNLPGNGASAACLLLWIGGISTGYSGPAASNPMAAYTWGGLLTSQGYGATFYPPTSATSNRGTTYSAWAGLNGVTGKKVSKLTWPADPNRVGITVGFNWTNNQSGFGQIGVPNYHTRGPVAVYVESLHCNKKGWAVQPMICLSGYTTEGIAKEAVKFSKPGTAGYENNSGMKTVLQELRERQIEAGGSGNVVVWLNSGINDVGNVAGTNEVAAAAGFQTHIKTLITQYRNAWDSLGYPENDLAFMVSVTHPTNSDDGNMDSLRPLGKDYAETTPDYSVLSPYRNVTFVNIMQLGTGLFGTTYGGLTNGNSFNGFRNFYQRADANSDGIALEGEFPAHLDGSGITGGYSYLGELLIKRCLRYTPPI
jgi:hypothetical protein